MCWSNNDCQPEVAKEERTVYKLVKSATKDSCKSAYFNYCYTADKLDKSIDLKYDLISRTIHDGYHSYIELKVADKSTANVILADKSDADVILECSDRRVVSVPHGFAIAEFIIPIGSTYVINANGEIVSSNIIYTGKFKEL